VTRTRAASTSRRAAAVGALALAVSAIGLTVAPSAQAAAQVSIRVGGCEGGEAISGNYMTGYVWSGNGDRCEASISQNGGSYRYSPVTTSGVVSTPSYYMGWGSSGTYLRDQVCVYDLSNGDMGCGPVQP
jgi:hypothetical protein